jgi:hypothetical protein
MRMRMRCGEMRFPPERIVCLVHYISELPEARRKKPQWVYAVAVLDRAAITGDENDIATTMRAVAAALARD